MARGGGGGGREKNSLAVSCLRDSDMIAFVTRDNKQDVQSAAVVLLCPSPKCFTAVWLFGDERLDTDRVHSGPDTYCMYSMISN